jgi:hypothetical protein
LKNEAGGWPIIHGDAVTKLALLDKLVKLRMYDLRFLVNVYVSTDPKNPNKSILRVKQPHNFFNKDLYEKSESPLIEAYNTLVLRVVELFSEISNSTRSYKEDVARMFELEKSLAMVRAFFLDIPSNNFYFM